MNNFENPTDALDDLYTPSVTQDFGMSRRACLAAGASMLVGARLNQSVRADESKVTQKPSSPASKAHPEFPSLPIYLVRSVVGASHFNIERVRELIEKRPALARASWDWGFGDWETALGAASHTGQGAIAQLLMDHGARPNLFTFAMLGKIKVVRAVIEDLPGAEATRGPHGISLLNHAKAGARNTRNSSEHRDRAREVEKYLEQLGTADPAMSDEQLTLEALKTYVGQFRTTDISAVPVEIAINRRNLLTMKWGPDGVVRNLYPRGNHIFSPHGVEEVQIRFDIQNAHAVGLTINDPDAIITARRQ